MQFRKALTAATAAVAIIPIVVLAAFEWRNVLGEMDALEKRQRMTAERIAEAINERLSSALELMLLAASELPELSSAEVRNRTLAHIARAEPAFLNLHFDTPEGISRGFHPLLNPAGVPNNGVDHRGRRHWKERRTDAPYWISASFEATGAADERIVNIGAQARTRSGELAGFAVCALDLKKFAALAAEYENPGDTIWITDSKGGILYASRGLEATPIIAFEALIPEESPNAPGPIPFKASQGQKVLEGWFTETGLSGDWRVMAAKPNALRQMELTGIVLRSLVLILLVLGASGLAGMLARRPIEKALFKLQSQVAAARPEPLPDERIHSLSEFEALQSEFGRLMKRLSIAREEIESVNRHLADEVARQTKALRTQMEMLSRIFESLADGLLLLDQEGVIIWTNQRAERLFAASASGKILGSAAGTLFAQCLQSGNASPARETLLSGGTHRLHLRSASGDRFLDVTAFPIEGGDRFARGILLHDATDAARMESLKENLIGVVAHELKTPLAAIALSAETLARRDAGWSEEFQNDLLQGMQKEVGALQQLISDWLDVARIDGGTFIIEKRIVQLKPIILRAQKRVRALGPAQIRITIEPDAECVNVDPDRFLQLLTNLLSNSVRYRALERECIIDVHAEKKHSELLLSVTDNGIGIPEGEDRRIFDRFYQVNMGMRRRSGGTGLGLVISLAIVRAHGGTIEVASTPGVGSTFTVRIPY